MLDCTDAINSEKTWQWKKNVYLLKQKYIDNMTIKKKEQKIYIFCTRKTTVNICNELHPQDITLNSKFGIFVI